MKLDKSAIRNAYFLGTKVRNLRKRNNLTIQDLSARCIKLDAEVAPSVSYLSMIERGKRVPSPEVLGVIAAVFQKDPTWFLDDSADGGTVPTNTKRGGAEGMALEPGFLFSQENLQLAIPDLLSQAAVTGREFAHLLIRAHQEYHQNQFPDLERAAEEVGKKRLDLTVEDLLGVCDRLGMEIRWVEHIAHTAKTDVGTETNLLMRSYFDPPNIININKLMSDHPVRLKYDLAAHIGHRVLHDSEGARSSIYAGTTQLYLRDREQQSPQDAKSVETQDVLQAWRDFESSFFAGALLCPRIPFRRMLEQHSHEISIAAKLHVSRSVVMRRMTAVSNYPYWHYFDVYPPGRFKAVYRGNGIPLPWGNMRMVEDPCPQWGVFRQMAKAAAVSAPQISVFETDSGPRLYACESIVEHDLALNPHVLSAGIEIGPALEAQNIDAGDVAAEVASACRSNGSNALPDSVKSKLSTVAKILNIGWLGRGLERPAQIICQRSQSCPRPSPCNERLRRCAGRRTDP